MRAKDGEDGAGRKQDEQINTKAPIAHVLEKWIEATWSRRTEQRFTGSPWKMTGGQRGKEEG